MGGYISLAATRGCRATLILCTAALALCALLLSFAGSASAAPAAEKVFKANSEAGLTEPSGLAVTPDGTVWASDALLGVCRVDIASGRLLQDKYCAPEFEAAAPVDGIELPPPNPERPAAAFQIAFDSTDCPEDADPSDRAICNFYVAEGSSGGSGVWRMHWNSEKRAIDAATKIYEDNTDQRIMGLALAPGGAVDFAAKRNSEVRRIKNAATASIGVVAREPRRQDLPGRGWPAQRHRRARRTPGAAAREPVRRRGRQLAGRRPRPRRAVRRHEPLDAHGRGPDAAQRRLPARRVRPRLRQRHRDGVRAGRRPLRRPRSVRRAVARRRHARPGRGVPAREDGAESARRRHHRAPGPRRQQRH